MEMENKYSGFEEFFRIFFDKTPISIILMDISGKIVNTNKATEVLFGFTKEELLCKNYLNFSNYPENSSIFTKERYKQLLDKKYLEHVEIQIYKKDKTLIWVSLISFVIKLKEKTYIQVFVQDITQSKLLELKLKKSEENFEEIIQNLDVAYYKVNLEGVLLYHNRTFNKILGYGINDNLVGTKINNLWLNSELINDYLKELKEKGSIKNFNIHIKEKDKEEIIIQINAHLFSDKNKESQFIEGTFTDITEQYILEQKLIDSEQRYKDIAELLPVVIFEADQEFNLTYVNKIAFDKFDFSREDYERGINGSQILSPEDRERGINDMAKFFKGKKMPPQIYKLRKKDGSLIITRINSRPIYKNKKIVGIRSVVHDITDLVKAEEKLKEEEQKFRTITDQSFIGIAIIQDFQFKYTNKRFSEIIGYNADEVKKWAPKEFLNIIHPEDREYVNKEVDIKYFGKDNILANFQFRVIKKTGETIWLDLFSKTINYEGNPADLMVTIDITKQKEIEEFITLENKKYKTFLDVASHDLRTPLTSIYGATQLLKEMHQKDLSEDVSELIEIAHHGSERLKRIVLNILNISRLESNKLEIDKQKNNLVDIINDCVKDLSYLIERRNQNLSLELPDEFYLNVDRSGLEIALTNLISNSIKYTPPNGNINIKIRNKSKTAKIIISDDGIGLTKEELDQLFKKFVRFKRTKEEEEFIIQEGTGLGLYISREIVRLHGGDISVKSEGRNKGSTFTIELPYS